MLNKKQIKWVKMAWNVLFTLGFFAAMLLSISTINVWGNYEKNFGVILITAMGVTLFFQAEYRLVRKPLFLLLEKVEEMKLMKWIEPMDKKKAPEDKGL